MSAAVLFGSFFVLLLLTVPIGYAIGISSLIAIYYFSDIPLIIIAQKSITGVDSFPLLAIPFFMLAGNLMSSGGIARRLVNFFDALIGHVTGGLGMVTIIVCMFFALGKIIDFGVDRIVYISCKPTSLVRDLVVLQDRGYRVEKVCGVDMFHVLSALYFFST